MKLQDRIKGLFTATAWFILLRWAGDNFCPILVGAVALCVWENDVPSGNRQFVWIYGVCCDGYTGSLEQSLEGVRLKIVWPVSFQKV